MDYSKHRLECAQVRLNKRIRDGLRWDKIVAVCAKWRADTLACADSFGKVLAFPECGADLRALVALQPAYNLKYLGKLGGELADTWTHQCGLSTRKSFRNSTIPKVIREVDPYCSPRERGVGPRLYPTI